MKKSLITLAVASGLMASGAVYAEATVYGHAQVEVASWGGDSDGMSVEDNARGRLGVKASEDMGDGMKGLALFEFKVDTADGDADTSGGSKVALSKREMMVGLGTPMGQIELGRLKSAYKYFGGVKYDPYVATVLEARGNAGMSGGDYGHNSFISDSFGYEHGVGAASFRLTYDLDDGGGAGVANATGANGMTVAFKFETKAFEVIAALADDDAETLGVDTSYSATKIGGQLNMIDDLKVSLQLESVEQKGALAYEADILYLDVQYKVGKGNVADFAWGNVDVDGVADTTDFLRLAFTHKLSKETKTWVGYRSTDDNSPGGKVSVMAVGLQKQF